MNANLGLRGDIGSPTAKGHNGLIENKLKMNGKYIFIFLLKSFLRRACLIKLYQWQIVCLILKRRQESILRLTILTSLTGYGLRPTWCLKHSSKISSTNNRSWTEQIQVFLFPLNFSFSRLSFSTQNFIKMLTKPSPSLLMYGLKTKLCFSCLFVCFAF